MKSNFRILIVAIAIMFVAFSCGNSSSSVDTALAQIEKAMNKVEKNKTSMTEADWKALNEELEESAKILNEALESDKVGALKKLKISAVILRYAAVVGEAVIHTATDSLKVKMNEMHLADSISAIGNKLQEALESEEIKQAIEELKKATENLNPVE